MGLKEEIEKAQRQVRTDSLSMSIGEIVSMYQRGELIIRPPFQRLFRWEMEQKSRLIESILLGIPIPPIFVFEAEEGIWELIDGLQRLSTILEFMGILLNDNTKMTVAPSYLEGTGYLPSLRNTVWEKSARIDGLPVAAQRDLPKPQQFSIRTSKIDVRILKRPSDPETKYDLFQRLNRGGTIANAQEIRNCMVIMVNESFFKSIDKLVHDANFRAVIRVSEVGEQKQRYHEMAMRFIVFLNSDYDGGLDVEEFIDRQIVKLAEKPPSLAKMAAQFSGTFELLNQVLGNKALQKWDADAEKFGGKVGQVALEVVAVGVARNFSEISKLKAKKEFVEKKIKAFWEQKEAEKFTAAGLTGTQRLKETIAFGDNWFAP